MILISKTTLASMSRNGLMFHCQSYSSTMLSSFQYSATVRLSSKTDQHKPENAKQFDQSTSKDPDSVGRPVDLNSFAWKTRVTDDGPMQYTTAESYKKYRNTVGFAERTRPMAYETMSATEQMNYSLFLSFPLSTDLRQRVEPSPFWRRMLVYTGLYKKGEVPQQIPAHVYRKCRDRFRIMFATFAMISVASFMMVAKSITMAQQEIRVTRSGRSVE